MFIDETVIAGAIAVGLCLAFLTGFGVFCWRDAHRKNPPKNS
ncbi:cytochrome c oxidase subunit CcoM [Pseudomonas sp.]|jgi:hypothetical protein|nr:cytochrome c oxidase subunit CcoM [Pseudomonas sp.]